jgi:SAM-dependent methyltransferase
MLALLRLKTLWRRLRDWAWLVAHHYGNPHYREVDLDLRWRYLLRGPYAVCKAHCVALGEYNPYQYGETPMRTLDELCRRFDIRSTDSVYELGCGPGYTALWLRLVCGCRVVGIDRVPHFVTRAQRLVRRHGLDRIDFRCQDLLATDYSEASFVYLYGTCLDDEVIRQLLTHLEGLRAGARVLTVSYSLSDYGSRSFELIDRAQLRYTWGTATTYLQRRA